MNKTYRKVVKNPLGLAITTITNNQSKYPNGTFTDADIDDKDKEKLTLCIMAGMVVEVNTELEDAKAKEELAKSTDDLEAITILLEIANKRIVELKDINIKLSNSVEKSKELKAFAYELMNAEELAKFYTVDDLKEIATKLKITLNSNEKEGSLVAKIVEKLG